MGLDIIGPQADLLNVASAAQDTQTVKEDKISMGQYSPCKHFLGRSTIQATNRQLVFKEAMKERKSITDIAHLL